MKEVRMVRFVAHIAFVCVFGGLFCPLSEVHAQMKKPKWSSGWESEKSLVKIRKGHSWPPYYALPCIARNLRKDGKWVLISNMQSNYGFLGYYWDDIKREWISDDNLVKGLKVRRRQECPAIAHNVTGDEKWTLITRRGRFYGYYWDGTKWVEDSSRVNGLPTDIGFPSTSHTFIKDLKGDGKRTLLAGTAGAFRAFYWNGGKWAEDPSRVKGLPGTGGYYRVTAGFDVFGDKKWNLITTTRSSTSYKVFRWGGTRWVEDKTKALGLNTTLPSLVPALAHNLTTDGKWVLISGVGQLYTLLGFQYNRIDTSSLPPQKDITSCHPLATTVRIKFTYPRTWNHRVRYSTKSDMNGASWSKWFEDMADVDIKLEGLSPATTYYYQVYTYVPWDISYYVTSPRKIFKTIPARKHVLVNPGQSIQDAIETLPREGGTVELAPGVHDVRNTIVISRSNVTIQGSHKSEIRSHSPDRDVFSIPHENPSLREPWDTMPVLENLAFKGFKVTSTWRRRGIYAMRGTGLIRAWNVKNITVEDVLDDSYLRFLIAVNPTGRYTKAQSMNIYVRNNNCLQSEIVFCFSKNVHVTGNTIRRAVGDGIDINRNNDYVYIRNNKISGGANYNIRGHGGNYVWIENNTLLGGTQIGISNDGLSNVTVRNNTITGCSRAAMTIDPQSPRRNVRIINNRIYNNPGHGIATTLHRGFRKKISDVVVINNVISNNGGDGIKMIQKWVQLNIRNNIITGNKGYGINYIETPGPTIITYNNFWNNAKGNYNNTRAGEGDISADPLFANPAKGDFHLRSKAGRWDPKAEKWVKDRAQSPCINTGDPEAEFSKEPAPNGGRVNIGVYGNTKEASKSKAR